MVVDAILSIFMVAVEGLVSLFPTWSPGDVTGLFESTELAGLFGWIRWADWYLPMSDVLVILQALLVLVPAWYAYRLVVWVLTKAHILGGDGT